MINTVTPNRALMFAVGGFVLYWLLALFVPAMVLRDVFNSLAFGAAFVITLTWLPSAVKAVREGANTGEWMLILAIFLMWLVALTQRVYSIAFNYYERPDAWANSAIPGFFPFSYLLCGLLFLAAPGKTTSGIQSSAIWALVAAFSVGSLLAGIMIGAAIPTY